MMIIESMNTMAIEAMQEDDLFEAADAVNATLAELSECCLLPKPVVSDSQSTENDDELSQGVVVEPVQLEMCPVPSAINHDFYNSPFYVGARDKSIESKFLSPRSHKICAMVSLFNLGLCHHLQWLNQKEQSFLLSQALHFYQEAYSFGLLLRDELIAHDSTLKVLMAICVNGAHCSLELGQVQIVRFFNDQLARIVAFAHPSQRTKFFSQNAFYSRTATYHTALAA